MRGGGEAVKHFMDKRTKALSTEHVVGGIRTQTRGSSHKWCEQNKQGQRCWYHTATGGSIGASVTFPESWTRAGSPEPGRVH